jgi:hypothetical protein
MMSTVVRLEEGHDGVQAYVAAEVAKGFAHVYAAAVQDNKDVIALIGDLTEEEGMTVTPVDIWRAYDVMKHMTLTVQRSQIRFEALLQAEDFVSPPPVDPASVDFGSFAALRSAYIDGIADVLAMLRAADQSFGLEATSTHPVFGTYNWQGWTVFSHHVHTHDHIGQLTKIVEALRPA